MTSINVDVLEDGASKAYEDGGCDALAEYIAATLRGLGFTVTVASRASNKQVQVEVKGNQCISHVITPIEVAMEGRAVYDMEYFTNDFELISLGLVETITAAIAIVCTSLTLETTPRVIEG